MVPSFAASSARCFLQQRLQVRDRSSRTNQIAPPIQLPVLLIIGLRYYKRHVKAALPSFPAITRQAWSRARMWREGMANLMLRNQMLDSFSQDWIEFEGVIL